MKKIISLAPGRTCLFGDHQDYLGLPVIACAIDRNITLTAVENDSKTFVLNMIDINEVRVIDISATFETLEPRDYFASSLRVLRRYGCIPTEGYTITITGNIPINSGTSSSSALLMAWIRFLIEAFGINHEVTPEFISKLGYESEVLEHGEPGGMMDHFSIGVGNIVHINTKKPFSFTIVGSELKGLITGVSGVPKETIGLLGNLKGNALMAIDIVKQNYPDFDLNTSEVEDIARYKNCLPDRLIPFFEAALKNYQYTKDALQEFEKPILNLKKIGELMNQHHQVLRDLLKITVPRIDDMINAALKAGAYGAKIVGSGGGGSIVVIADPVNEDLVIEAILKAGAQEAYAVRVDPGVRIIKNIKI
ncbi:mevalonate kinase family protein [Flavobacterium hercynium]|uniref:Galactokinase n=1 Tax=Flavobacterium hercynium TaxID=387094 RepID=A0A226GWS9_9FLAO|nr:galactokinase family protein [Flavobacterium hercynium]OXA86442.1 galactokinase [Flavobacterium hercynium]SMP17088.1 galactokinase [Flavobacterium hercynium]